VLKSKHPVFRGVGKSGGEGKGNSDAEFTGRKVSIWGVLSVGWVAGKEQNRFTRIRKKTTIREWVESPEEPMH